MTTIWVCLGILENIHSTTLKVQNLKLLIHLMYTPNIFYRIFQGVKDNLIFLKFKVIRNQTQTLKKEYKRHGENPLQWRKINIEYAWEQEKTHSQLRPTKLNRKRGMSRPFQITVPSNTDTIATHN